MIYCTVDPDLFGMCNLPRMGYVVLLPSRVLTSSSSARATRGSMTDDVATAAEAARNCALSNGASADIRTACCCKQRNTQEEKRRAASVTWIT